jgi:hypothetical protein
MAVGTVTINETSNKLRLNSSRNTGINTKCIKKYTSVSK